MSVSRVTRWAASSVVVNSLTIVVVSRVIPGFQVDSLGATIAAGLALALVPALAWPLVYRLSATVHPVLFPIRTFLLNGVAALITVALLDVLGIDGVTIDGLWAGIAVAFGMTFVSILVSALFTFDDDRGYDWFVDRLLPASSTWRLTVSPGRFSAKHSRGDTCRRSSAGSTAVITSSRPGILIGNNTGIPAFRWWDKPRGQMVVTSKFDSVRALEAELGTRDGLLVNDGASRWNVFSGSAVDSVVTFSTFGAKQRVGSGVYADLFSNVFVLARTFGLYLNDIVREVFEAWNQRRRDDLARQHRELDATIQATNWNTDLRED